MSDFWELYDRPEWREVSREVMDRAGYRCQDCGATDRTLNAHHTFYLRGRKPWEYPIRSLRCLCEDCHETRHEMADKIKLLAGRLSASNLVRLFQHARGLDMEQDEENRRALGLPELEEFDWW